MGININDLSNQQLIKMCLLNNEEALDEFFQRFDTSVQQTILTGELRKIKFPKLKERHLIKICLLNNDEAWEEFFRRYLDDIKTTIIGLFLKRGLRDFANDMDIIQNICVEVIIQVRAGKNDLSTLKNIDNCKPWLRSICFSKTMDWFREKNLVKNLSKKQAESYTRSIDGPVSLENKRELVETLIDPTAEEADINDVQNKLMEYENQLKRLSEKELWIIRLRLIYHDPLTEDEVQDLSKFTKMSKKDIIEKLDIIKEGLDKKAEAKEKERELAGKVHAEIMELQKEIYDNRLNSDFQKNKYKEVSSRIDKKNKRLEQLRRSSDVIIEPSNEQIAEFIEIPKEKANKISLIVLRAIEKIKKGYDE